MIGRYQAYPEYKDSGVEWLGGIPKHWNQSRVKFHCSVKGRIGFRGYTVEDLVDKEEGALVIGASEINSRGEIVLNNPQYISWKKYYESPEIMLEDGMVLVVQRGSVGRIAYVPSKLGKATINPSIIVLRDLTINPLYLTYCLKGTAIQNLVKMQTSSTAVPMISQEQIGNYWQIKPPLGEQTQISNFLDHETARIDTLIEKQQQLIKLLKEKRQAVISHAVTKGLKTDAPMKDSGVEWLGEVPEHWEITKIGFLSQKTGSGKTPKGGSEVYLKSGILFLRSQNVYDTGLRCDEDEVVFISEEIDAEMSGSRVKGGDILLNITGASIGRTCIVPDDFQKANVNQHVCIIRVPVVFQKYLSLYLKSTAAKAQIDAAQNGAAREGLNFEELSNISISLPKDVIERESIANFLNQENSRISTLIEKAYNAIELMQERRTALISAAVTGKIDVRNWQPPEQCQTNKEDAL